MLRTMGGLSVEGVAFRQPKPLLLLAYLAIEGAQARRHLAELFWPGEAKGLRSLTAALIRLRQGVPGTVEADETFVRVTMESDVQELMASLEADAATRAIALYRGPFLAGFHLSGWGAELEEWVYATREFLAEKVQEAHLRLAEGEAARGDFRAAARRAETAYALPGAPEPSPEGLERFYSLLVAGDSSSATEVRQEAEGYGIRLSLRRDEARERLREHGETDGQSEAGAIPHKLPSRGTSFVGRDPELVELGRLLSDETTRLITLTGAGGIGKSRLALQAAAAEAQVGNFSDGIYFVPLEALADPALVPSTIASALGLKHAGKEQGPSALVAEIKGKQMLLVLDNFEQLTAAATVVSDLIRHCPHLKLLVTSRERLILEGEQVFPLEGLPVAADPRDFDAASYHDAVRLFVQRAKRARLDFALNDANLPYVLEICGLVQGSPLAIELAAALVRLLSPEEIARELEVSVDILASQTRDVPERQRSLRATFEYSWSLLASKEQAALRQLAVFVGGFTRQAAAEVAGVTIPLLMSLVDKSLLQVLPGGRYDRHPLLYQYTQEKLAEHPEELAQTQATHARFFLALAEEAEAQLEGPKQTEWLRRLETEHDNVRAALHWAERQGEIQLGLRLGGALWRFWHVHGHLSEGYSWLKAFLSIRATGESTAARAKALHGAGVLAWTQGALPPAHELLQESLALVRKLDDKAGMAKTLNNLGIVAFLRKDYAEAQVLFQESLDYFRDLEDASGTARTLGNLSHVVYLQGDIVAARRMCEEVLARFRELNDAWAVVTSLNNLGRIVKRQGDYAYSLSLLREGLILGQEIGAERDVVDLLEKLAGLLFQRRPADSARLWGAAEAYREAHGTPRETGYRLEYARDVADARRALDEVSFARAWTEGKAMLPEEAVALALAITDGGHVYASS